MSNPTHLTSTSTLAASGLRSNVQISTEAGLRDSRLDLIHDRVSPESTMSSTISTCRPVMSESRSLRMRTTPLDLVPDPDDDTAIQSTGAVTGRARIRSAMTMTAPLRTPTSRRSLPAYSWAISPASSASLAWISSSLMRTRSRSAPMWAASTAAPGGWGAGGWWCLVNPIAGGDGDPTAGSGDAQVSGGVHRALPVPPGEQPVAGVGVPGADLAGRGAGRDEQAPPDPGSDRARDAGQLLDRPRLRSQRGHRGVGQVGEVVGVVTQQGCRARQRRGHPRPEVALQVGQGPAGADPGEGRVLVHRVVPPGQALRP